MKTLEKILHTDILWTQPSYTGVTVTGMLITVLIVHAQELPEVIPTEACIRKGYCEFEDTPNYPHEIARKLIKEYGINSGERAVPEELPSRRAEDNYFKLCPSKYKIVTLSAALDRQHTSWEWNWILNDNKRSYQSYRIELCSVNASCTSSGIAVRHPGFRSKCEQEYMYKNPMVLRNMTKRHPMFVKLPSCCYCKIYRG